MTQAAVYVASCDRYDPESIAGHVRKAADALGVTLPGSGSVLLHPSCPLAHPRFAPDAVTNPAVVEGAARSVSGASLTLATASLPGFPTRYSLGRAGYDRLAGRLRATKAAFDEGPYVPVPSAPALALPRSWVDASFRIALPRLTGSAYLPFAGALRQLFGLLPAGTQSAEHHRMVETIGSLVLAARPDLVVVDAITATHRGGEPSGWPVDLGLLIIGTDPVAVDLVCGAAYGVPAEAMRDLVARLGRADAPGALADVRIIGDVNLEELGRRGARVERMDPAPENHAVPRQVRILRSPRASPTGVSATLTEAFAVLDRAGISLDKARETTIVIGAVDSVPPPTVDTAAIVFMDDTSRATYAGYSRIVRLTGRTPTLAKVLIDVPFAMTIANVRAELGLSFTVAGLTARLSGMLRGSRGPGGAAAGSPGSKGGGDPAAENR